MKNLFFRLFSLSRPLPQRQKYIIRSLKNTKSLILFLVAVFVFILLLFQPALAGAPPIQWQKTFGGTDEDLASSVQQTTDGGYIIASQFSIGEEDSDIYLIKTNPNGDMQWQKTFDGIHRAVQQTSDGGYIIVGGIERGLGPSTNAYLIKTAPNGNSQWAKTFVGNSGAQGYSVQQTIDGGYIIAGYTYSYGSGYYDVYLIKTDPNGNSQWQKTFGGSYGDSGRSVQQTSDGGYIIAGSTSSYGAGNSDVYLIKTDPCGKTEWESDFGGASRDAAYSVQQTTDGGYIITGYTTSYGAGGSDVYLVKTDPNGNSQWQKTFGGSNGDLAQSVQQTSDDGYIIVGGTSSYGAGRKDVFLIKTDPNGNSRWQKTFGGYSWDEGYSVQQTSDGGYIIAGYTDSYGAGDWDVYLIKLCSDGTLSADFNCNGTVYYEDLEVLVGQWLQQPDIVSADIAPEIGDGIVNGFDFAVFSNDWLQSTIP